jgi:hypothetical protein
MMWGTGLVSIAAVALLPCAAQSNRQSSSINHDRPIEIHKPQSSAQATDTTAAPRKKQIQADSAKLLALAVELKAEVDKTNKDTLSINVIRKADEIENFARDVKEKQTKLTAGGN